MIAHKSFRVVIAIVVGVVLGWLTAYAAQDKIEAGVLVLLIGAVFNAVVITVVSDRFPILIVIVPVFACSVCHLYFAFGYYAKYEGMSLSDWWNKHASIGMVTTLVMIQLLPALIASGITYAIKSKCQLQRTNA